MNIESLYAKYLKIASDPTAAATLVLAHVQAGQTDRPELLDTTAAAEQLGVSKAQVQSFARNGQIRHIRVGRLMKFKPEHIDEFLRPASFL
ncbi:Helix-turn-helix domain protein [Caulifigura coniformis]|uniref:Helix-turn-helix domain protein n=1 Tax=Caulifigura coniformis TaxID=2527983 RepID=A0A517SH94_9PLAN|nr:helix-turn-helix domain-containing protein [Caulifigura coniformis]QDT55499.1 Helix-turn-helix domain protein [Caulifigura coniformis]